MSERILNVIIANEMSDALLEKIRAVSPRLNVHRYFPDIPEAVWQTCDILFTTRDLPEPEQAPQLRWIQLNFAGIDGVIGRRIVQAPDVLLTTASGVHAETIAHYCLMMLLNFHLQLPRMIDDQSHKRWRENRYEVYQPRDLRSKTVGIVGYGTIGRELARLAQAVGLRVLATKRDVKHPAEAASDYTPPGTGDPAGDIPERLYPPEALTVMAPECDFLVVTAPLTPATHHMVNAAVFAAMKPEAILINIARGGLVDEKALVEALQHKQIGGAALDVYEVEPLPADSPLWEMDNVLLSPHAAGNSTSYGDKVVAIFTENLRRYLEKKPLVNLVNRDTGY